jgi:hypothetical protein
MTAEGRSTEAGKAGSPIIANRVSGQIQGTVEIVEIRRRDRFLCMLWSKGHFENGGVSLVWRSSARNVAA